jgi:hypothetical protein
MKGAIRTKLLTISALTDIISQNVWSAGQVPSGTALPYVTLFRVHGAKEAHLETADPLYRERWQLRVHASTDLEAEQIKEIIIPALDMKHTEVWSGYYIYLTRADGVDDNTTYEVGSSESTISTKDIDFIIKRSVSNNN